MLATGTFTAAHLATLRREYGKIRTANPDVLPRFRALFAKCNDRQIKQLALAQIPFVSALAVNEQIRRAKMVDAVTDFVVDASGGAR